MVAHIVRLRLTLLANTLRRSVWQTIGLCLAALYGMTVGGFLVVAVIIGGRTDPVLTAQIVTLVGAVVVLGWWIVPLFAFGVDATLDPARFVAFAIPRRRLMAGLAAAGAVSVPAVATLLAAVGSAFAWRTPLALAAALLGALGAVALCIVGSRATTTALAPLLDSRRYREVLMVVAIVPLLMLGPVIAWMTSRPVALGTDGIGVLADIVAWTPFGAPWALATAVHDGAWALLVGRLAVVVVTLGLLWWLWDRSLARALVAPRGGRDGGRARDLGWFARLPATPTGAVAARAATYWWRDPRYSVSLAVIPLLPVALAVFGASTGVGSVLLLVVAPLTAFLLGFAISNDIGYDSTAFALHVATGVPGRADRWGRVLPVLGLAVPLVVALAVVAAAVSDRWDVLPALLGSSLAVLGAALGTSSVVSARLVYPVPQPGQSPFRTPQGATVATMLAQTIALGVVVVVTLPTLALAVLAMWQPNATAGWVAVGVGLVTAVVALVGGVRWGARLVEQRRPELLAQVTAFA